MAVGNIVLRISSTWGPGGLASLQAGVQMVDALGRKVVETVQELDKFYAVRDAVRDAARDAARDTEKDAEKGNKEVRDVQDSK